MKMMFWFARYLESEFGGLRVWVRRSWNLTPKALANSSPGFGFDPGDKVHVCFVATLKELRLGFSDGDATCQGLRLLVNGAYLPWVAG